jgi:hypothetical protein
MKQMAWKLVQFCVFTAVLFSNIYYQWSPSGLAAGVVALLATLLVSAIPVMIEDLAALFRRLTRTLMALIHSPLPTFKSPALPTMQEALESSRASASIGVGNRDCTSRTQRVVGDTRPRTLLPSKKGP